jgi:hypothetical protein
VARLDRPNRSVRPAAVLPLGTKRVRQPGHGRARASIAKAVKPPDLQDECARVCPRVPACPSLVVLS